MRLPTFLQTISYPELGYYLESNIEAIKKLNKSPETICFGTFIMSVLEY